MKRIIQLLILILLVCSPPAFSFWHGVGASVSQRTIVSTAITYCVATTGNDGNTGFTPNCFATIQKAIDTVADTLDLNWGGSVRINVADGTYAQQVILRDYVGAGNIGIVGIGALNQRQLGQPRVAIIGNDTTPGNVIISGNPVATPARIILAYNHLPWFLSGFQLESATSQDGIEVGYGSYLYIGILSFGEMNFGYGIWAPYFSVINFQYGTNQGSDIYFNGGTLGYFINAYDGAHVHIWEHATFNFSADTTFDQAFVSIGEGGILTMRRLDAISLNGHTVTGKKADVWNNGQIFLSLNSGGEQPISALPGSLPATIDYGSFNGAVMAAPNVQTDSYTLLQADGRRETYLNKATGVTVTLPKTMVQGFTAPITQQGAGQITYAAESGATLHSLSSANKSTGQYGRAIATVLSNSDGQSAVWTLSGDIVP